MSSFSRLFTSIGDLIIPYVSSAFNSLAHKPFQMLNFFFQGLLFSVSVIHILSALALTIGLNQSAVQISKRWTYIGLALLFLFLNLWQFSDSHKSIHEGLKFMCEFYMAFNVIQGCFYIKQKIQTIDRHSLQQLANQDDSHQNEHNRMQAHNKSATKKQLCLIFFTLLSAFLLIYIWYNIKIVKSIVDNKIIPILIIFTAIIYTVSLIKNVSLFLPQIICCFCIYFTISIRILFDSAIYPTNPLLSALNIPFESLIILIFGIEGKQNHKKQITLDKNKLLNKSQQFSQQQLQEQARSQKMLVQEMFWACAAYYLYSVIHGDIVRIEYMFMPVYVFQVLKGNIY